MAYYLAFTSGSEYVDIPSPISVSGDGLLAEIDFEYKGASNDVICGGTSFSDFWRINNDNQFRISIAGTANNVNLLSPLVIGTRYMLKLVRTGSSVEVRDSSDTPITSSTTLSASPFVIGKIGSFHNGSSNLTMDLYGFKAGAETYDPSLSNGTGSILPTVSGSNQGVLTNFPTDDSQWVFYSAPSTGVEASVTESSSDFSESSAASFTATLSAQVTEVNASFTEYSSSGFAQAPAGKWYLKFDGVNDYVSLPSPFSLSSVGDYIELDVDIVNNDGFFFSDSLGNFGDVFSYVSDRYRLRIPNSGAVSEILAPTPTGRSLIKLTLEAGGYQLNVDGVDLGVMSQPSGLMPSIVGAWSTGSISTLNLYRLKVSSGGSLMRDYNPSLSGGVGTILTESENNQDGTLVNFPSDDSQWVAYQDSINAIVTELVQSFSESSSATITNNIVSVSVTETSQDFSESALTSISGSLAAIVTELNQSFTESSTAEISANISAAVTELAQDFNESAQVNLTSSFTVEVTETTSNFEEACYIQLPVQRLTPRKTISVSNRRSSTIRVRSRNNVIRVK